MEVPFADNRRKFTGRPTALQTEDLVYIGIFLTLTTTGKANVCMNLQNSMKECSGMCDSFMLMNSVSSEFLRTNYFYHAVCNINFVLIQEHSIPFLCACFLIQTRHDRFQIKDHKSSL